MKILIAEDDPVSVKILQFTLEHFGHEVVTAGDGAKAWEAFDRDPVRVIVSDWMMPGLDGLELCQKVRQRVKTDYTYFILLTAINTGRDNLRQAMEAARPRGDPHAAARRRTHPRIHDANPPA